jgi:hypothetical protein
VSCGSSADEPTPRRTAADASVDDAKVGDAKAGAAQDDSAAAMPTGMGDVCVNQNDCAGKDAAYCAIKPPDPTGTCTVKDCNAATNDCPTGFVCCDFVIDPVPNYCSLEADFAMLKQMNMCL